MILVFDWGEEEMGEEIGGEGGAVSGRVSGHSGGDHPAAEAAVDFEIGVSGEQDWIGQDLREAD